MLDVYLQVCQKCYHGCNIQELFVGDADGNKDIKQMDSKLLSDILYEGSKEWDVR